MPFVRFAIKSLIGLHSESFNRPISELNPNKFPNNIGVFAQALWVEIQKIFKVNFCNRKEASNASGRSHWFLDIVKLVYWSALCILNGCLWCSGWGGCRNNIWMVMHQIRKLAATVSAIYAGSNFEFNSAILFDLSGRSLVKIVLNQIFIYARMSENKILLAFMVNTFLKEKGFIYYRKRNQI